LSRASALFALPWPELQALAWKTRQEHHPPVVDFAVPGLKRYQTEHYQNNARRFAAVSISGSLCKRGCQHCEGRLLLGMLAARTPRALLQLGERLRQEGCRGLLLSGACDDDGAVPLLPYLDAIAGLKALGLSVIAHTGLLDRETALGLKQAGLDLALFDVVGDEETYTAVLGLRRAPADCAATLALLAEVGLAVAPHVIVGLHFGQVRGEIAAIEMIAVERPAALVVAVLRPLSGTPMSGLAAPSAGEVGRILAVARLLCPRLPVTLGCARPSGTEKVELERRALLAGVNAISYPDPATVSAAAELGLAPRFREQCCCLATASPG